LCTVLALLLTATSCGARLTKEQLAAALRSANGSGSGLSSGPAGETGAADTGVTVAGGPAAAGGGGGGATTTTVGPGGATGGGGGGGPAGNRGANRAGTPLAAGVVVSCPPGAPSTDPGVTATTIAMGNVSTLTGPVPGIFLGAVHGAQAFINFINSYGGVCGRKLVLKSADDNLDPGTNGAQVASLSSQVLGFLGSFSVVDQGGVPSMQSSGVPDVGFALSADRFNLPNNFSPQPQPPGWQLGPLNYYKNKFGADVVSHSALFIQNAQTAIAAGLNLKAAAQSLGYQFVVEEDAIEPTQSDFSAEVQQMKSKGVKAVFWAGTAQAMGQMAAQMYSAGLTIPMGVWGANAYDPTFLKLAGPGAEGAILNQNLALYAGEDAGSNPMVALFDQWFHRSFPGSTPDLYAAYGWLSGLLFVLGLNIAGAPTRAGLVKALKTIDNFDGGGMIAPNGPGTKTPPSCFLLIDVKGGKFARDPADPPTGFRCGDGAYFRR
jgi:ABC-type branched-subunit amino acid transport system substrate-binding protein